MAMAHASTASRVPVGIGRVLAWPGGSLWVGRRVGRVQFGVYAARSLVARVGADAPLGAYPWIHWDERLDMRWLDAWLAQHAPGAEVALRVSHYAYVMESGAVVKHGPSDVFLHDPDIKKAYLGL